MHALGPEWQSKIRSRRESVPENGPGGRNVSELRTTNETEKEGVTKPDEARSSKENDGPKGGKAGLNFGRRGYYPKQIKNVD